MSCGVGHNRSSDLVLLHLWCRLAAAAPKKKKKNPQRNKSKKHKQNTTPRYVIFKPYKIKDLKKNPERKRGNNTFLPYLQGSKGKNYILLLLVNHVNKKRVGKILSIDRKDPTIYNSVL